MAEILNIIDPEEQDPKKFLESIRYNFIKVGQTNLKAGTYLLADVTLNTTETFTSTTYKALAGLSGSFNSSGGLVFFDFSSLCVAAGHDVSLALFIDGAEKGWSYFYPSAGGVNILMTLTRFVQLEAGKHTWEIKCKIGGGTITMGPSGTGINTTFSAVEFLRG